MLASDTDVPVGSYSNVVPAGDIETLKAAIRKGGIVRLEQGDYPLIVSGHTVLNCGKSVRLIGEGSDLTRIITEKTLTASGTLCLCSAGTRVAFEGLTVAGPINLAEFACCLVIHLGGNGGRLVLDDAVLQGGHMAARIDPRDGAMDDAAMLLRDSVIASPRGIVQANAGTFDAMRTEFRNYGLVGSNKIHAAYLYPSVRGLLQRCGFAGNAGDGLDVHCYSPTSPTSGWLTISDGEFHGTGRGILTHPATRTQLVRCRLDGVSVEVQHGGALLTGCKLRDGTQVKGYPSNPGQWMFRDCES